MDIKKHVKSIAALIIFFAEEALYLKLYNLCKSYAEMYTFNISYKKDKICAETSKMSQMSLAFITFWYSIPNSAHVTFSVYWISFCIK